MPRILFLIAALALAGPTQAAVFHATMTGDQENPPNSSTATGPLIVTVTGDMLTVDLSFTGLSSPATAAHLHCCVGPTGNAGVAIGFPSFPATMSGSYMQTFDLNSAAIYGAAFLTAQGGTAAGAKAALLDAMFDQLTYINIHNTPFPGGEIRGQLVEVAEPAAAALLLLGLGGIWARVRRRTPIPAA